MICQSCEAIQKLKAEDSWWRTEQQPHYDNDRRLVAFVSKVYGMLETFIPDFTRIIPLIKITWSTLFWETLMKPTCLVIK